MVDFRQDRTNIGGGPTIDNYNTEEKQPNIKPDVKTPKTQNENQKVDKIVEKPEKKSKWC
jgi:hypothetical protein